METSNIDPSNMKRLLQTWEQEAKEAMEDLKHLYPSSITKYVLTDV